jgi:hypothetical protein
MPAEDYAAAQASWFCRGCSWPRPSVTSVDVRIAEKSPGRLPLTLIFGAGVGLIKHSFLRTLVEEAEIQADLFLGRVVNSEGDELDDWATFRGRRRLIIRGSKNVAYRMCSECGRDVYFAMGKPYLHPRPPEDAALYQAGQAGLLLPIDAVDARSVKRWPGLYADRIKVAHVAMDGLPALTHT